MTGSHVIIDGPLTATVVSLHSSSLLLLSSPCTAVLLTMLEILHRDCDTLELIPVSTDTDTDTWWSPSLFGGGPVAPRVLMLADLWPYVQLESQDAFANLGTAFELIKYAPETAIAGLIDENPGSFSVPMPLHTIVLHLTVPELKSMAKVHNEHYGRGVNKGTLVFQLLRHRCAACERYAPLFVPHQPKKSKPSPPTVISAETTQQLIQSLKPISYDMFSTFADIPPQSVDSYHRGTRLSAIVREGSLFPAESLQAPHAIVSDAVPWESLCHHTSRASVDLIALHHGIKLLARLKKPEAIEEFKKHVCVDCPRYSVLFTPVLPVKRVRKAAKRCADHIEKVVHAIVTDTPPIVASTAFPPPPLSADTNRDIIREFCADLKPTAFEESGCAVCGQLKLLTDLTPLANIDCSLDPLVELGLARKERHSSDQPIEYETGPILDRALSAVCSSCLHGLEDGKRPRHALANGLWIGEVPQVLADLTFVEQLLIARVRTNRYVVRISSGHSKMVGNAISFTQPMAKLYHMLPPTREDLSEVLAFIFTGIQPPGDELLARTPMLVRRNAVAAALEWLKLNHSAYSDLAIDYKTLESYPLSGVPVDIVFNKSVDGMNTIVSATSIHETEEEQGSETGPMPLQSQRIAYHLRTGGHILTIGHADEAESMYDNPSLYPSIFPWLFPYGSGELGSARVHGIISERRHKKWLLLHHDKRFQVEARFVLIAFNHEQIKAGSTGSTVAAKRSNFHDIVSKVARLNPAVLRNISHRLQEGERVTPETQEEKDCFAVLDQVENISTNVFGSMAGKKMMRSELWSLVGPQEIRDKLMSSNSEFTKEIIEYLESCHVGEFSNGTMEELQERLEFPRVPTPGSRRVPKPVFRFPDPATQFPVPPPENHCLDYHVCDCSECEAVRKWEEHFSFSVDHVVYRSNIHSCYNKVGVTSANGEYKEHVSGKGCINKDGICTARFPRKLIPASCIDPDGHINMKKLEQWINTINRTMAYCFGCNTDSSSLLSGTAVKATAGYVADYIVKMGLKTYEIFSSIYDVFEKQTGIWSESDSDHQAARRLILKMANSLAGKIEIGGPMAAMYLLALRWITMKKEKTTYHFAEDDDDEEDMVLLTRGNGRILSKSSVDDYRLRPAELSDVCLYDWTQCSLRKPVKGLKNVPNDLLVYEEPHPLRDTHRVRYDVQRVKTVVPNLLGGYIPKKDGDDREFYCSTMLTLFVPWRTGLELRASNETWEAAYERRTFSSHHSKIIANINVRYECYDARDDYHHQMRLRAAEIMKDSESDDEEDAPDFDGTDEVQLPDDDDARGTWSQRQAERMKDIEAVMQSAGWVSGDPSTAVATKAAFSPERNMTPRDWRNVVSQEREKVLKSRLPSQIGAKHLQDDMDIDLRLLNDVRIVKGSYLLGEFATLVDDHEYKSAFDTAVGEFSLNKEQLRAFSIVANHASSVGPEPLQMYVGGMGGTGKTRVIDSLRRFFNIRGEGHRMVVLAPTGAAASVISGSTYHSFLGVATGERRTYASKSVIFSLSLSSSLSSTKSILFFLSSFSSQSQSQHLGTHFDLGTDLDQSTIRTRRQLRPQRLAKLHLEPTAIIKASLSFGSCFDSISTIFSFVYSRFLGVRRRAEAEMSRASSAPNVKGESSRLEPKGGSASSSRSRKPPPEPSRVQPLRQSAKNPFQNPGTRHPLPVHPRLQFPDPVVPEKGDVSASNEQDSGSKEGLESREPEKSEETQRAENASDNEEMNVKRRGLAGMPAPDSSRAPYWNEKEADFEDFLDLFEEVADGCELDSSEKVKAFVRYAPRDRIKEFWKTLSAYEKGDWAAMKEELMAAYPGVKDGRWYMIDMLEKYCGKAALRPFRTESDVVEYYQGFLPIAKRLIKQRVIGEDKAKKYFYRGIHEESRAHIALRLDILKPDRDALSVPTIDDVYNAARHIYSNKRREGERWDPVSLRVEQAKGRYLRGGRYSRSRSRSEDHVRGRYRDERRSRSRERHWDRSRRRDRSGGRRRDRSNSWMDSLSRERSRERRRGRSRTRERKRERSRRRSGSRGRSRSREGRSERGGRYGRWSKSRSRSRDRRRGKESGRGRSRSKSKERGRDRDRERRRSTEKTKEREKSKEVEVRTREVILGVKSKDPLDEIDELTKKLHGLNVTDVHYAQIFNRLAHIAPNVAQYTPKPQSLAWSAPSTPPPSSVYSQQASPPQNAYPPPNYPRQPWGSPPNGNFAPRGPEGCHFCREQGHVVRDCPIGQAYKQAGRVQQNSQTLRFFHADWSTIERNPGGMRAAVDLRFGGPLEVQRNQQPQQNAPQAQNPNFIPLGQQAPRQNASSSYFECVSVSEVHASMAELREQERKKEKGKAKSVEVETIAEAKIEEVMEDDEEEVLWGANVELEALWNGGANRGDRKGGKTSSGDGAFTYESKADDPTVSKRILEQIMGSELNVKVKDLLASSPGLRREVCELVRTTRVPTKPNPPQPQQQSSSSFAGAYSITVPSGVDLEFVTPQRELRVRMGKGVEDYGVLDEGSEIVVMVMKTANGSIEEMQGCAEWVSVWVDGLETWVHAFVVPDAPFRLLLGRPWQKSVMLRKEETSSGVDITIFDPKDKTKGRRVSTRERLRCGGGGCTLMYRSVADVVEAWKSEMAGGLTGLHGTSLGEHVLSSTFRFDEGSHSLAYKPVHKKVRGVRTETPPWARIERRFPEDPLKSYVKLTKHPSGFRPGERLTEERWRELGIEENEFLWPEERRLAAEVLMRNEMVLAWTEDHRGEFSKEYFPDLKIPVLEHQPWQAKPMPIPPAIREQFIELVKRKIETGVYERCNSAYRHQVFAVAKKNGKIRIVHNLTPLNAVSISDAAQPPLVELLAEQISGKGIYTGVDLYVGYDHRTVHPDSRDLLAFDTPLGTVRLTKLPQGWQAAVQIFHGDVVFILQFEMDVAPSFLDDIFIHGKVTRYELKGGGWEVLEENPKIRRFVYEHFEDVNRILHRLKHVGATISATKLQMGVPELKALGQVMTYEGRKPDMGRVAKIESWLPCQSVSEVRGFLGTVGTVRVWVRGFAEIAKPLTELCKKDVEFVWREEHQEAMDRLKKAVVDCPVIRPIDYKSEREVILAVDSSNIACGFILQQLNEKNQRVPSRFAQARALWFIQGASRNEVMADRTSSVYGRDGCEFVKGMLNNPDMHPNAAVNRWIAGITLFNFKLVHVSGTSFVANGPDGLSRRRGTKDVVDALAEGADEWLEEVLDCGVWVLGMVEVREVAEVFWSGVLSAEGASGSGDESLSDDEARLLEVKRFLETLEKPEGLAGQELKRFLKRVSKYFVAGKRLWRREASGRHQLVLFDKAKRLEVIRACHDEMGHHEFWSTRRAVADRFWWPKLDSDVQEYVKTCHQCQIMQQRKVVIPPTVSTPAPLFSKAYIDTMHLPPSGGCKYLVQARCSLSHWVEWRALTSETGRTLGEFIFEEILCRWGSLSEIVTDNGPPFVAALDHLKAKYAISHIAIRPYNSQSNGSVEVSHKSIRTALVKVCDGDIKKWKQHAPAVFWADRITTRKSTGFSPYYAAHGVEPLLPFDITESTFLFPEFSKKLSDSDLLSARARQLERREEDLQLLHERVLKSRFRSIEQFERIHKNTIEEFDFQPGDFVLVLNKKIEKDVGRKAKPRYFGPMVVVKKLEGSGYLLAEVNGAVSRLKFASFRLVPYHSRYPDRVKVTEFVDDEELLG
ncbi:hypothetical protein NMY22_g12139 [Coprinellus aureogranulatus]|nr:hypothetical protein NMY22_g12139 [Coprinellus aureogranulatus]